MSKRPVVLVVMDGVGIRESDFGNAVSNAYKPTLDNLWNNCPHTEIKAHGVAVGLPSDGDMGNSEVGHNALGCGQIYSQGAKLVNESIESGDRFTTETWKELVDKCKDHGTMHFLGLLSDGNVHTHIDHLKALITRAKELLMNRNCMTEEQAHRFIQKRSMDTGAKMVQTARKILDGQIVI